MIAQALLLGLAVAGSSAAEAPRAGAGPAAPAPASPEPLLETLRAMAAAYARVRDYTCLFERQERVGGRLRPAEQMRLWFRKPFSARLLWVGRVHHGRRAVYEEGRNRGRIRAREGGLLGVVAVNLDPRGGRAMSGNRHPMTEIGIGHLIGTVLASVEQGLPSGLVELGAEPEETHQGRSIGVVRIVDHRAPPEGVRRRLLRIDRGSGLPVAIESRDASGQLLERYAYRELVLDPGLTAEDFRL